jgi:hypothetical protein
MNVGGNDEEFYGSGWLEESWVDPYHESLSHLTRIHESDVLNATTFSELGCFKSSPLVKWVPN